MPFDGTELPAVTKHLIDARERVHQGWCQDVMRYRHRVCMLGALDWQDDPAANNAEIELMMEAIGHTSTYWSPATTVANWNDAPGRTKEEVLAAFDRAIELSLRTT